MNNIEAIMGMAVLIMRRSPEAIARGTVIGEDNRGKIVVRQSPSGQEFKAPPELRDLGYAQNRRGGLRFAFVPMSPEAKLFMADKDQV